MYFSSTPAYKQKYLVLPIPFNYLVELNVNPVCKKADYCSSVFHKYAADVTIKG